MKAEKLCSKRKMNKLYCSIALGLISQLGSTAIAQEQADVSNIEKIQVTGVRASLTKSLNEKRFANKVVDVITAEDIGKFPEANLSEAIQRVPGVTINRNPTGEGSAINLRGLGPEFTSTEVNGMLGGGTNGTRGFSFEIFPAELFNKVEISKSVTADQVEGGIAGSVSLYTPTPLSFDETVLNVSAFNNYSDNTGTNSPKVSSVFNKNWDDKFGINAAVVYANTDMQSNAVTGSSYTPLSAVWRGPAVGKPGGPTEEEYSALYPRIEGFDHTFEERETIGATLTAQWAVNDNLEIIFRSLIGTIDSDSRVTVLDAPSESNITAVKDVVIENGVATQATLTGVQQRVGARQSLIDEKVKQFTLSATSHLSDNLTFSPYIGYFGRDKTDSNDLFSFRRMEANGTFVPADVSYVIHDDYLEWSTPGTNFTSNPEEFVLNVFIRRPYEQSDSNATVKFDFDYDSGDILKLNYGLRYTDRKLEQQRWRYDLRANNTLADGVTPLNRLIDIPTLADVYYPLTRFQLDGVSFAPSTLIGGDPHKIISTFFNADGSGIPGTTLYENAPFNLINSYGLTEKTIATYVQAIVEASDDITISSGLRLVKTDQSIGSQTTTNASDVSAYSPVTLKSDYQEALPNINVRYQLNDEMIIRSAYFKSLTRPALAELATYESFNGIDEGGGKGSRGNPDLKPFTADNYDIGFEWYFTNESVAAVNLFYKDLDGFIDTSSVTELREFPRQSDGKIVTGPIIFSQPTNGVSATISGIELAYQTRLGFVSEFWDDFGLLANYTAISSDAQYSEEGDVRNSGLPGLSKSSYNLAFYYDVPRFNVRMSYTWRDSYLVSFASTAGIPQWQDAYGQLDLSANYEITEALQLQLQALNILSEKEVNRSVSNTPYDLTQIDRRLVLGVRYDF